MSVVKSIATQEVLTSDIKRFPYEEVDTFFKKIDNLNLSFNKNHTSHAYFDDEADCWKEHDFRFQYTLDYGFIFVKITAYNIPDSEKMGVVKHFETVEFKIKDTDTFFIPIDSIDELEDVFMRHYNIYINTVVETVTVNKSFEALKFSYKNLIQSKIFVNTYYEIKTLVNSNGENVYTLQDVYTTEFSCTENLDSLNMSKYGTSKIGDTLVIIKEDDLLVKDSNDYVYVMSISEFEDKFKTKFRKPSDVKADLLKAESVKSKSIKTESVIEFQKNILLDMIRDIDVSINIYSTLDTEVAKEKVLKNQMKKDMTILMYEELFNVNYPNI